MRFEALPILIRQLSTQILVHKFVLDDFQLFQDVVVREQSLFKLRLRLARQLAEEIFTNRLLFCRV